MFEHEAESDEDCEVYFLKPVNEYNIVDKIKEANKELFAEDSNDDAEPERPLDINRKVTFALNLEDYEPVTAANKAKELVDSEEDEGVDVVVNELEAQMQSTVLKCATIIEEPLLEVEGIVVEADVDPETIGNNFNEQSMLVEGDNSNNIEAMETKTEETCERPSVEDEDEICEEIIITDMDCEKAEEEIIPGRRIVKQTTFDCDEQDNKSMTNLLPSSDCEYEADDTLNDNDDDVFNETFANTLDDDDDYDNDNYNNEDNDGNENDDLSIIVASYLTDDMFMENVGEKQKTDKSPMKNYPSNMKKLPSFPTGSGSQESKQNRFFSTKRFSLRRKSVKSQESQSEDQKRDIKLSYKTCCEYRNAKQEKLPKYTGYLSEYGLSHDQLVRREDQYMRRQRYVLEQTLKSNEDDMKKMQDNERAFTRWLKNKMRYPINKTRNMFDAKLRNRNSMVGSYSGSAANGDNGNHECSMMSTRFK